MSNGEKDHLGLGLIFWQIHDITYSLLGEVRINLYEDLTSTQDSISFSISSFQQCNKWLCPEKALSKAKPKHEKCLAGPTDSRKSSYGLW